MNNPKKTLLYSGTIPGEQGVGGIVLNDLCEALGKDRIQCFAAMNRGSHRLDFSGNPYFIGGEERRFETAYRPIPGMAGSLISSLAYRTKFLRHANQIAKRAVDAGREFSADVVWAVLDCPALIVTAKKVANRLGVPLHILVWDAPELLARQLGHCSRTTSMIIKSFRDCLENADRIAVAGESMRDAYQEQYGVQSIVLRHGLPLRSEQKTEPSVVNSDQILIGYAGSITASDTFQNLMEALASCNWSIGGKQVVLRIIGARYQLEPRGPQRIEYYGWQPAGKPLELLRECDLLYLPQPFDQNNRELAELSFPTKLTTYLAAQQPVLLHAPDHASVVPFFGKYPFGIWCNSLDKKQLLSGIDTFLKDQNAVQSAIDSGQRAVTEELNADVFVRRFGEFMNCIV